VPGSIGQAIGRPVPAPAQRAQEDEDYLESWDMPPNDEEEMAEAEVEDDDYGVGEYGLEEAEAEAEDALLEDEAQDIEEDEGYGVEDTELNMEPGLDEDFGEGTDQGLPDGEEDIPMEDADDAAEETPAEGEEEEQQQEEEDHNANAGRDELTLDEVPAEHADAIAAVETGKKIKRILSGQISAVGSINQAELSKEKASAARSLGLAMDSLTAYVLNEVAEDNALKEIVKSRYKPSPLDKRDSLGAQVAKKLLHVQERSLIGGDAADPLEVFCFRWKVQREDKELLRKLPHATLRHIVLTYSGAISIKEAIEEAEVEAKSGLEPVPSPDTPGPFSLGRFNRLELIQPSADALVVGDANLTFSCCLARHRTELCHVGRVIATTFEDLAVLKERYTEIEETMQELADNHAEVYHNVDGTRLAVDTRFLGMQGQLGAVYYNFPHAGAVTGFYDGHPFVRWRHENLMHLFFRALRSFVQQGGVVKIASNSNATGVRFSDILSAADSNEFLHVETYPFQDWVVNRYRRSYGDRRDAKIRPDDGEVYRAQQAKRDMVYSFRYEPTKDFNKTLHFRRPPTRQEMDNSTEGPFRTLKGAARQAKLDELSKRFISEVQGVHVG